MKRLASRLTTAGDACVKNRTQSDNCPCGAFTIKNGRQQMSYCNFFIRSFTNGQENQGEYTFPGYRIRSRHVPFLEFDNTPENEEGYEQIGEGYLFWYQNYHVIMRKHQSNGKKVLWGVSNKRIQSNNYGYYPIDLPFCSKRKCLLSHLQRAIRWHKRYHGKTDDLLRS